MQLSMRPWLAFFRGGNIASRVSPILLSALLVGCGPDFQGAVEDTPEKDSEVEVADDNSNGNSTDNSTDSSNTPDNNDNPNESSDPKQCDTALAQLGKTHYETQCAACHGAENKGGAYDAIDTTLSIEKLVAETVDTMPIGNVKACGQDCAEAVIYYLKPAANASTQCNDVPNNNDDQSDSDNSDNNNENDTNNDNSNNDDSSNNDTDNSDSNESENSDSDDSSNSDSDTENNDNSDSDDSTNDSDSETDNNTDDNSDNSDNSDNTDNNTDDNNSDNDNSDNNTDNGNSDTDNSTPPEDNSCDMVTGKAYWEQTCAYCHGKNNEGGVSNGANIQRLVSKGTMSNQNDIAGLALYINDNMPGTPSMCTGDQPGTCAYDTAQFIMNLQNGNNECQDQNESQSLQIEQKPLANVLYKSSLSLVSRFPTEGELNTVQQNGMQGLDSVLEDQMKENAFYDRLKEIYNDMLLLGPRSASKDGYNEDWYKTFQVDGKDTDESRYARELSLDGFDDEVFHLIRYVVENNRPFTEILTADYTAVNPYSAHVFGVYEQLSFRKWEGSEFPDESMLTDDPNHIRKVKIDGLPHAGLLTTRLFLDESDTSNVNRNRHRSYLVFDHFMNFDLFSIPGTRPMAESPSKSETIDNPTCSGCHNIMDPVASAFQNYDAEGRFKVPSRWYSERGEMQPTGFAGTGEVFDPESGDDPLQWVAQRIANDSGFAEATVKRIAEGLTGQKMLRDVEAVLDEDKALYELQQSLLNVWKTAFINSNYNLKTLIKTVIKSPYYQPASVTGVSEAVADKIGAVRLLTPEMLTRKYQMVMGEGEFKGLNENAILYGGIDYDSVTTRLLEPNGFIAAIQETYANKAACDVVKFDFDRDSNDRMYFSNLSLDDSPSNSANESKVKAAIQKLIWRLWGEVVDANNEQVTTAYNLIKEVHEAGMADNSKSDRIDCSTDNGRNRRDDSDYVERSWNLLVTYLLADFKFLYE